MYKKEQSNAIKTENKNLQFKVLLLKQIQVHSVVFCFEEDLGGPILDLLQISLTITKQI